MITYQPAIKSDLAVIAALHAQSWQQHNRGILDDDFLDNKVKTERLVVWTERFTNPTDNQYIITAKENKKLCGFTCLYGGKDPKHGTYLDNLHVDKSYHGKGIGRKLMALAGQCAHKHYPNQGLYLFVFAANTPAIGFYQQIGGVEIEIKPYDAGDGTGKLVDTALYYWQKPELITNHTI